MPINIKSIVLSAVKKESMPIYQIAKQADMSVQTTSKYCHILEAENRVEITKFGNMKLVRKR